MVLHCEINFNDICNFLELHTQFLYPALNYASVIRPSPVGTYATVRVKMYEDF
jgi:hypothetical protein